MRWLRIVVLMSFEYIDTHSHVAFPQFDADREAVLARMREKGVHTIAVGVDFKTSRAAVALAQLHRDVVVGATIGVHPTDSNEGLNQSTTRDCLRHMGALLLER